MAVAVGGTLSPWTTQFGGRSPLCQGQLVCVERAHVGSLRAVNPLGCLDDIHTFVCVCVCLCLSVLGAASSDSPIT